MDSRIGMRDTAIDINSNHLESDIIEFYWDVILLTELQFLLPYYSNGKNLKSLQKNIISNMGNLLNSIVKNNKTKLLNSIKNRSHWRILGTRYTLVYLPLFFKDIVWCKSDSVYFHVILPHNNIDYNSNVTTSSKAERSIILIQESKEWLLALLELSSSLDLQIMRLYICRSDIENISTLLRNLNWIGGKLVANEDRNNSDDVSTSSNRSNIEGFNDLMLSDENFVILEFEC